MIRLSGHSTTHWKISRRRRVSNQLAAFAAVMLFASTQVNSPDADGADLSTPANLVSHQVAELNDGPQAAQDSAQEVTSQPVSSVKRPRARGLNLNLFLFNR